MKVGEPVPLHRVPKIRGLSSVLADSMIRASTRSRSASSPPAASLEAAPPGIVTVYFLQLRDFRVQLCRNFHMSYGRRSGQSQRRHDSHLRTRLIMMSRIAWRIAARLPNPFVFAPGGRCSLRTWRRRPSLPLGCHLRVGWSCGRHITRPRSSGSMSGK